MHCVPPSKRHALCNANGRGWRRRTASWQLRCRRFLTKQYATFAVPRSSQRGAAFFACTMPPRNAYLRPASNNPVTNRRANTSFLDMPRAHTRIRISTPHVGVLITFIGACMPPFRHHKRTATKQRLLAVNRSKSQRGPGIATSGTTPNSAPCQLHRLDSKPRQPQRDSRHGRVLAAAPAATGPTARRRVNGQTCIPGHEGRI